jgi:hypothetical protein
MTASRLIAAEVFVQALVRWINGRLTPPGVRIAEHTLLFEDGLIDSIKILKLIAWTECAVGYVIPDHQIRMDNFSTPLRIAEVFVKGAADAAA